MHAWVQCIYRYSITTCSGHACMAALITHRHLLYKSYYRLARERLSAPYLDEDHDVDNAYADDDKGGPQRAVHVKVAAQDGPHRDAGGEHRAQEAHGGGPDVTIWSKVMVHEDDDKNDDG